MHLHLEADNIQAEARRLEDLGAPPGITSKNATTTFWVLRDPWNNELWILDMNFSQLLGQRRPWLDG